MSRAATDGSTVATVSGPGTIPRLGAVAGRVTDHVHPASSRDLVQAKTAVGLHPAGSSGIVRPDGRHGPGQQSAGTATSDASLVHVEPVMGTAVSITVYDDAGDPVAAHHAVDRACDELRAADELFSTWKPWSPMSRLRRGAARLDMFPDDVAGQLASVLALSWRVRQATDGWFDPWAIPGGVDPTGLVKGWALEQAAAVLRRAGLLAIVNGGGDIVTCGTPLEGPWRIGVRHPWRPGSLACVVTVSSSAKAVATSGSYERGAHFVDPRTGARTVGAVASATVVGADLAVADGLATALAVGGEAALDAMRLVGYEAYLVGHDASEQSTDGFPFS